MKFCKDCIHFVDMSSKHKICGRGINSRFDLVTGNLITFGHLDARKERNDRQGLCGEIGRFFQSKEQ